MGLDRGRGTDKVLSHRLYHKSRGQPQLAPPKFRRLLKTTVLTEDVEADYEFPDFDTNEVFIDLKQYDDNNATSKLTRILEELTTGSLTSYRRTKDAQIEKLSSDLVDEDTDPLTLSELHPTFDQDALGDGKSVRVFGTIPTLFTGVLGETEKPDITPTEFKALLPTHTYGVTAAGTADPAPALGLGEYSKRDEQQDVFTFRETTRSRDLSGLPVAILGDKRTTRQKQVETVDRYLEDEDTLPEDPTELLDVTFHKLGDGTAVEEQAYVDSLFTEPSYETAIEDPVPRKFRGLLPTRRASLLSVGTAAPPTLGTGELTRSSEQINVFVKRDVVTDRDATVLPVTLIQSRMTRQKQIATEELTLDTGLQDLTGLLDELTEDASIENLGNNTSIRDIVAVDSLFTNTLGQTEIPDRWPEEFKALLPRREFGETLAGTADPAPTLAFGEYLKREEQQDVFTFRRLTTSRDAGSLPVEILGGKRTTKDKQVLTVDRTLEDEDTLPTNPTALLDVSFTKLGDGTALEELEYDSSLFPNDSYGKTIPNRIPESLRAVIPISELSIDEEGSPSTNPTLLPGEFSRVESRLTEFTRRIRTTKLGTVTLPVSTFEEKLTEQFGGGRILTSTTMNTAGTWLRPVEGLRYVAGEILQLGEGHDILTSSMLVETTWPVLGSFLYDENMRTTYFESQQVVAYNTIPSPDPGIYGGFTSEVKAIDKWRSRRINVGKPLGPHSSEATALISYDYKPFKFPGYLYFTGTGYYVRRASSQLCRHTIKTWFVRSAATPSVFVDEIFTDQVIINELNDVTKLQYADDVLHDALTTFGVFFYPATTPSASQYAFGRQTGVSVHDLATLYAPGTGGLHAGQTISISGSGHTCSVRITSVYDVPGGPTGLPNGYETLSGNFPDGTFGPFTSVGGTQWFVVGVSTPVYDSNSRWIGTSRVVAATVTPEREPNLWKIQTRNIVMR